MSADDSRPEPAQIEPESTEPADRRSEFEAIQIQTDSTLVDPTNRGGSTDPTFATTSGDPVAILTGRIDELAGSLADRLDGLHKSFEREIRAEATREKVIARLHAELQEYKQDFLLTAIRPVLIDLIGLHDDLGKVAEVADPTGPVEPARLLRVVEDARQAIEDILYRQGVEPYQVEGDAYDPRRQRAVSTRPTSDDALHKSIADRLRPGFRAGDRVIRPEVVSVHAKRTE